MLTAQVVALRAAVQAYEDLMDNPTGGLVSARRDAWLEAYASVSATERVAANKTISDKVAELRKAREEALTERDALCAVEQAYGDDYRSSYPERYERLRRRSTAADRNYEEVLDTLGIDAMEATRDLRRRHARTCKKCKEPTLHS